MTFSELIEALTQEQVNSWWENLAQGALEKVLAPGWKYYLCKDGINRPYKSAIRDLADAYNLKLDRFSSEHSSRDRFCDKFKFTIKEDLKYDNTELNKFKKSYDKLKNKEIFTKFIKYASEVFNDLNIEPYKIRMGIRPNTFMAIIGMRGVLYYSEKNGNSEIYLILSNDKLSSISDSNKVLKVWPFKDSNKSLVSIGVENWDELGPDLLDNNKLQILEEYYSIKDTKRVKWQEAAQSTNSALKYLMFKNLEINEFLKIKPTETNIEDDEEVSKDEEKSNENIMQPLNQILYGPPGTGKTYNTINKALAILGESDILETGDRELIKKKFDEYVALGQVVFTTFHQSMSYEDFIEGIKPHTSEEGKVVYEVEDGIFKSISRSAEEASKIKKTTGHSNLLLDKELLDKSLFFKVSLGDTLSGNSDEIYDWCIKNNRIAVGWGGDIDFKNVKDEKDIKAEFEVNGIEIKGPNDYNLIAVKIMMLSMKIGDLVFVSNGNRKLKAIGKIVGGYNYMYDISIPFKQTREVEWLYKDINVPVTDVYSSYFSQASIYQLSRNKIKEQYFINNIKNEDQVNPYVLIIDEINRGNVSQIFGELITLIEEDKRIGAAEEIRVKLPYSKDDEEPFGVPSNLYIIGTMNTADRSVEALDTALRRRFVFEEMLAKSHLLSPYYRLGMAWAKHWKHSDTTEFTKMWEKLEAKISELPNWKIDREKYNRLNKDLKIELKDWIEKTDYEAVFKDVVSFGEKSIRLDKMLENINARIEILLDKDHQIGHAFFVNVYTKDELKIVFENKILPLLQEYFYGDIGKIALVLGDSFIERVQSDKKLIQSDVYADKDLISVFEEKASYKFTHRDAWDFTKI